MLFCTITDSPFLALALLDLGKTRHKGPLQQPFKPAYSEHLRDRKGEREGNEGGRESREDEGLIWPKMSEEDWEGRARSR